MCGYIQYTYILPHLGIYLSIFELYILLFNYISSHFRYFLFVAFQFYLSVITKTVLFYMFQYLFSYCIAIIVYFTRIHRYTMEIINAWYIRWSGDLIWETRASCIVISRYILRQYGKFVYISGNFTPTPNIKWFSRIRSILFFES